MPGIVRGPVGFEDIGLVDGQRVDPGKLLQAHGHGLDLVQPARRLVDVRVAGMHEQTRVRIVGEHGLVEVARLRILARLAGAALVIGDDVEAEPQRRAHDLAIQRVAQVLRAAALDRVAAARQLGVGVEQGFGREIVEAERAQPRQQRQREPPRVPVVVRLVDQHQTPVARQVDDGVDCRRAAPRVTGGQRELLRQPRGQRKANHRLRVDAQFALRERRELLGQGLLGATQGWRDLQQVHVACQVVRLVLDALQQAQCRGVKGLCGHHAPRHHQQDKQGQDSDKHVCGLMAAMRRACPACGADCKRWRFSRLSARPQMAHAERSRQ